MGVKLDIKTKKYIVSYSLRHPITRKPLSIHRYGINSKLEAQRVYNQLVIKLSERLKINLIPLWKDLVIDYIKSCHNSDLAKATILNRELSLNAHTIPLWGQKLVTEITTCEIRDLINIRLADRTSTTRKEVLKFIRACFDFCIEKGINMRNPAPKMKFKIGNKVQKVLTKTQVEILLTKAKFLDSDWYPVWVVALYTGMRNGELYALTWDKVNFENRTILVNTSWSKLVGYKSTKSGDDRILEIAPNLLHILKELKLKNADSNFVLPRIASWEKCDQARDLRFFLVGIGLPQIRFHDLRATWCTLMLQNGIESIKVMKMGGWKNMATMERYIRQAGVDIKGITNSLGLHDHVPSGKLLQLEHV